MQKRPTSVDSVVHEHLRLVYDASATADVEAGVEDLVGRYRKRLDNVDRPTGLTERDVMLITYGDTLNQSGAAPLEVLHRFHSDHLRGVFDLVHILPFHPYSSDDGFSVIDYYAVRSDLGDWDAIQALSRDCRVMADAVVNHVSSQSGWFEGYLAGDPKYADFFIDCDPDADLDTVVRPRTSPLLTAYEDSTEKTRHIWTTFSADQADLNFANPKVLLAVIEVLFFLVSQGARLLRLDAVTFLWKQPGTSSANMAKRSIRCSSSG